MRKVKYKKESVIWECVRTCAAIDYSEMGGYCVMINFECMNLNLTYCL